MLKIYLTLFVIIAAVLATTGWDSYPMSTIEVGASGLPLLVSDLLGVRETVIDGFSGLRFKTGCEKSLADKLSLLLDDRKLRDKLGKQARQRIEHHFNRHQQVERFLQAIDSIEASG